MSDTNVDWFVTWQKRRCPRLRLFCFPYAGGGPHVFRGWGSRLPETIELTMAHPPSLWPRRMRTGLADLETFAAHLADSMDRYDDVPYACFGHSLGCLVSFQMVQERLHRGRAMPVCMIMSGRTAPHVDVPPLGWHALDDVSLVEQLRKMQGTPESIVENTELMELFLPMIRCDVELADRYRPAFSANRGLQCRLATYNGLADRAVQNAYLEEWQRYTPFEIRARWFPGGHFYIRDAQDAVLNALIEDLAPFTT